MKSTARIIKTKSLGYKACFPGLPGCEVYGRSRKEASDRLKTAVRGYLNNIEYALPRELMRKWQADNSC
ncbi:MAG: hypothetical protein ACLFVU_07580 [Phycisphaerae bacterium]